jgi:hypothetical protein
MKPNHIQQLIYAASKGDEAARTQLSNMGKRGARMKAKKFKANRQLLLAL